MKIKEILIQAKDAKTAELVKAREVFNGVVNDVILKDLNDWVDFTLPGYNVKTELSGSYCTIKVPCGKFNDGTTIRYSDITLYERTAWRDDMPTKYEISASGTTVHMDEPNSYRDYYISLGKIMQDFYDGSPLMDIVKKAFKDRKGAFESIRTMQNELQDIERAIENEVKKEKDAQVNALLKPGMVLDMGECKSLYYNHKDYRYANKVTLVSRTSSGKTWEVKFEKDGDQFFGNRTERVKTEYVLGYINTYLEIQAKKNEPVTA